MGYSLTLAVKVCAVRKCVGFSNRFFFLKLVIDFVIFHGHKLDISFREETVRMCCVAYEIVTFCRPENRYKL